VSLHAKGGKRRYDTIAAPTQFITARDKTPNNICDWQGQRNDYFLKIRKSILRILTIPKKICKTPKKCVDTFAEDIRITVLEQDFP
jgi:hypothetical protein